MTASWKRFEDYVRAIAALKFGAPCQREHVTGVDIDGVVRISPDEIVLIEITENFTLTKVREDITKISSVRQAQLQSGVSCKAYVIMDGEPTSYMAEQGTASKVYVLSDIQFESTFFNYPSYVSLRRSLPFGSAIDSATGKNDERKYVNVEFHERDTRRKYSVETICSELASGHKIVVIGDYGTGKSRLVREVFEAMKARTRSSSAYPIAINLREHWGSTSYLEILSGHLQSIGLSASIDNAVRLLNAANLIFLLDGFDEIGAQSHDTRIDDRVSLRNRALRGVRDLIVRTKAGVLITGRSHYFDDDVEIFKALGLSGNPKNTKFVEIPPSFTDEQATAYLLELGVAIKPPKWLPKKPLVFQIAAELNQNDLDKVLKSDTGSFEFWGMFLGAVTRRESKGVLDTISPSAVRRILVELGGISRKSPNFLGRFTQSDVNEAYRLSLGSLPDAVGQQLLARMCTIGRVEPQSPDRQFLDGNIADILRSEHVVLKIASLDDECAHTQWKQALGPLGVFHAAGAIMSYSMESLCFTVLNRHATSTNKVLLGEIVSVLSAVTEEGIDFKSLTLSHGNIPFLLATGNRISNLEVVSCEIGLLVIDKSTSSDKQNFKIKDSIVSMINGVSSSSALPKWIINTEVISYEEDVNNAASIRSSNFPGGQKLFLSVIHKIFFQAGRGREEASLLKGGYGQKYDKKILDAILRKLLSEGLIETFSGDDGPVYKPIRRHTERMARIKYELALSDDPLWGWAAGLT